MHRTPPPPLAGIVVVFPAQLASRAVTGDACIILSGHLAPIEQIGVAAVHLTGNNTFGAWHRTTSAIQSRGELLSQRVFDRFAQTNVDHKR